jgi:hypothetical protein
LIRMLPVEWIMASCSAVSCNADKGNEEGGITGAESRLERYGRNWQHGYCGQQVITRCKQPTRLIVAAR